MDIIDIQKALNALGFNAGAEDGILGPKTKKAIKTFKSSEGLSDNDEIDDTFITVLSEVEEGNADADTNDPSDDDTSPTPIVDADSLSKQDIKAIQQALNARGFDAGLVDGDFGPRTRTALTKFKQAGGLPADEVIDQSTLEALFDKFPDPPKAPDAPWFSRAYGKLLQHEVLNKELLASFMSFFGDTVGDPSKIPWCADFVESCMLMTVPEERVPTNPYLARNWLNYGVEVEGPRLGTIVVFYRGDINGIKGHVGFYFGEDDTHLHILGGNQSNRVCIARLDKERL